MVDAEKVILHTVMTKVEKEILLDILDLIKVVAARSEMSNDDFSYISDIADEIEDKINGSKEND